MHINECFVARSPTSVLVDMIEVLTHSPEGFVLHPSHFCEIDKETPVGMLDFSLQHTQPIVVGQ